MSTTASLADALLDDAAMFPPGNASATDALRQHLSYREQWFSRMIGPLLVAVERWPEFVAAQVEVGRPALSVVVTGTAERPQPVPAEVSIVGFELVSPDDVTPLLDSVSGVALEVPRLDQLGPVIGQVLELRDHGVPAVLKYRTGGTAAEAFPTANEVADVISGAVRNDVPVKFTAGLHHAVRHRDPATGFEHHGFLNLLDAVAAAQSGASPNQLVDRIEQRDRVALRANLTAWSHAQLGVARSTFVSFGCCGVTEPVDELVGLDLVAESPIGHGAP